MSQGNDNLSSQLFQVYVPCIPSWVKYAVDKDKINTWLNLDVEKRNTVFITSQGDKSMLEYWRERITDYDNMSIKAVVLHPSLLINDLDILVIDVGTGSVPSNDRTYNVNTIQEFIEGYNYQGVVTDNLGSPVLQFACQLMHVKHQPTIEVKWDLPFKHPYLLDVTLNGGNVDEVTYWIARLPWSEDLIDKLVKTFGTSNIYPILVCGSILNSNSIWDVKGPSNFEARLMQFDKTLATYWDKMDRIPNNHTIPEDVLHTYISLLDKNYAEYIPASTIIENIRINADIWYILQDDDEIVFVDMFKYLVDEQPIVLAYKEVNGTRYITHTLTH